jgi:GDPmannose 4,6-dehydratase
VPTALITGLTGQDGSYLAELLLAKGYRVVGLVLGTQPSALGAAEHLANSVELVQGDLRDQASLSAAVKSAKPDEVYNLAAMTVVHSSWNDPALVGDVTGLGATRLLDVVSRVAPAARFCQASSSEVFGIPDSAPQSEQTPIRPRTPYGIAKAYAQGMTTAYREQRQLFAGSAILYNHESPRRPTDFVSRKVTQAAARISLGLQTELRLGSLEARRDWGFAGDYVEAIWRMLQADEPGDYVVGTGVSHSVRDLCDAAFTAVGLDYRQYVVEDPQFVRPVDPVELIADASRARARLGWEPTVSFEKLVRQMVAADVERLAH